MDRLGILKCTRSSGPRERQGDDRGLRGCGREREDVSVFRAGGGAMEVAERLETHCEFGVSLA